VMDSGTGGLDLAYEVMRGYHGLIIVDVSKQGEEPGTLYLIEPEEEEAGGAIEDGEVIDPHGMDPATVLRFVKAVGGWPGKVYVVAVEPVTVEEMGMSLSPEVASRIRQRIRRDCSPRHVPDDVLQVPRIPRTLSGKLVEVPVKRILMGVPPDRAVSRESLADPAALDSFIGMTPPR